MAKRRPTRGGFELPGREELRKAVLDVLLVWIFAGTVKWIAHQWSSGELVDRLAALAVGAAVTAVVAWIFVPPDTDVARLLIVIFGLAGAIGTFVVVDPGPSAEHRDDCGRRPSDGALEIMVVWGDESEEAGAAGEGAGVGGAGGVGEGADDGAGAMTELEAFCEVVAEAIRTGTIDDAEVVRAGEDIGAELNDRFRDEEPPDVAILPQPSLVRWYGDDCHLLERINQGASEERLIRQRFPDQWNDLVTTRIPAEDDKTWGVFVKAAYKSMLWYSRSALDSSVRDGVDPEPHRWSWDDLRRWVELNTQGEEFDAPLTLAGHEGWPFTDWFENQLAGVSPGVYTELANRDANWSDPEVRRAVRTALDQMAELWGIRAAFAGGPPGVLATTLEDLDERLLDGQAALVFGASFVGAQGTLTTDHDVGVSGFPRIAGRQPVVVGGDVAVVPRQIGDPDASTDAAHDFVEWLTSNEAMDEWSRWDHGFLAPNEASPLVPGPAPEENVREWLTRQLLHPEGELLFDLSDNQLTIRNQAEQHVVWDDFATFFEAVTDDPPRVDPAIAHLMRRLERYYESGRHLDPDDCPARG